jgi:hypothetical protein
MLWYKEMGKGRSHDVLCPICTHAVCSAAIIINFDRITNLELVSNEFDTHSGGNIPEQAALQRRRKLWPIIRFGCIPLAPEEARPLDRIDGDQ